MMPSENSPLSQQDKRNFCAIMLQQYGLQIDVENELLPVFFVAYRSSLISAEFNLKTQDTIQKTIADFERNTASKISKLETKQFYFQTSKDAFWFAFGKYGVLGVIISILCFSGWLFSRIEAKKDRDTTHLSFLLENASIQDRKLNDTTSTRLIMLYPAKDLQTASAGKNYVYRNTCNCIEIPLYYHKTNTHTIK